MINLKRRGREWVSSNLSLSQSLPLKSYQIKFLNEVQVLEAFVRQEVFKYFNPLTSINRIDSF